MLGLYEKLSLPPHPRPEYDEENDLCQPFIPPIPAFFNTILALMILREKITISETRNDIGNGKTKVRIITETRDISNQARLLFPDRLSLRSCALLIT